MTRAARLAHATAPMLAVLLVAASCSPSPSPTPPPATPSSTWNPQRDVLDQSEALWNAQHPDSYAYTVTIDGDPAAGGGTRYRASSLEGRTEVQFLDGAGSPDLTSEDVSVTALYARARAALDAGASISLDVDPTYGYPRSVSVDAAGSAGDWTATVSDLLAAGNPAAPGIAQGALGKMVDRWSRRLPKEFEYTWSRFRAGDGPAASTAWAVHVENGKVRSSSEAEADGAVPSSTATPEGTVRLLQGELAAGAWVDVASESATGRDITVAVDPSPSTTGDAYWLRIAFTDLVAAKARAAQAAATERWTSGAPASYQYTWQYKGAGGNLRYRVVVEDGTATISPLAGSPPVEQAWVQPRVESTLAMLGDVLEEGGLITATYDKKLGFPTKAVVVPHGDAGRDGTITITGFKARK